MNLGGSFTAANLGTFSPSGGTVNLTGTLDNTGNTLTLDDAVGPWNLAGTIKAGTVDAPVRQVRRCGCGPACFPR